MKEKIYYELKEISAELGERMKGEIKKISLAGNHIVDLEFIIKNGEV